MPIFGKGVASGFPLEVETPQATPAQGTWTPIPFLSPHRLTARARGGRDARVIYCACATYSCACAIAGGLVSVYDYTCLRCVWVNMFHEFWFGKTLAVTAYTKIDHKMRRCTKQNDSSAC